MSKPDQCIKVVGESARKWRRPLTEQCGKPGVRRAEKGLTNGLREFIKVDNERALDVGSLSRGRGTFQVRKPKVPEGCPEVIVRENSDELTLTAEEVGTSKVLVNVNYIEQERWGLPLVNADWYPFCQALYKGIEGEDWEQMYFSYRETGGAVGVKPRKQKPSGK